MTSHDDLTSVRSVGPTFRLIESVDTETGVTMTFNPTLAGPVMAPAGPNLTPAQAVGLACVVCGRAFIIGIRSVPVGRSETGSQVFACVGTCATSQDGVSE
jgi:hypothetical protein